MTKIALQGFKDTLMLKEYRDTVSFLSNISVLDLLFRWRNDYNIYQWCRQDSPISWGHHTAYWEKIQVCPNNKMFLAMDGQSLTGAAGLTNINWQHRHAEFSLFIGPEHQGKDCGRQAMMELFRIGFNDMGLNKIWGETFEHNPARKLFEKIGMKSNQGHYAHYFRQGKPVNTVFYYQLAEDYFHENNCRNLL